MLRATRVLIPCAVAVASIAACSGANEPSEKTGSTEQELIFGGFTREPVLTTPTDAGTDTSSTADTSIKVVAPTATLDPGSPAAPCAPMRYDVTTSGRTCWDLAKTTPTGTFTVTPIFSSAPAAIRDTRCALTWIGKAGVCGYPDWSALALNCAEQHSMVGRSAACAADPSQCAVSGSLSTVTSPSAPLPRRSCTEWGPEAGIIPNGYGGGCDSCGIIDGGYLYLSNPYGGSALLTNVTTAGGGTTQLSLVVPAQTTTAISVPTTYSSGPIYLWPNY